MSRDEIAQELARVGGIKRRLRPPAVTPSSSDRRMGHVYFMQGEHGGPVKIGFATDLDARLSQLQVGRPDRLRLLASIQAEARTERLLHTSFEADRLTGEWFTPSERLVAAIQALGGPVRL